MKRITSFTIFIILILTSCENQKYETSVAVEIDSLDNGKTLTKEIVKTINKESNSLISLLTRIKNSDNDYKTILLTGIRAEDGMSDWLVDSLFYPDENDTLIVNYKKLKGNWEKNQNTYLKYSTANKIIYFKNERLIDMHNFKKEIFYTYDDANRLIRKVEFECSQFVACDSLYKQQYYYNKSGSKDSTTSFIWTDNNWQRIKRKNNSR